MLTGEEEPTEGEDGLEPRSDTPPPLVYEATCTKCPLMTEIEGQEAALEFAKEHKFEHGLSHFVDLTLVNDE